VEGTQYLLRFTPAHRRLLGGLGVAFTLLVSLGIHGFSVSCWHLINGGSCAAPEVLIGKARRIRADDWLSFLPLALAQRAHEPRFPLENRNVGLGQNALVPFQLPVAHPLVLLRPQVWGFFLGDDAGLAWLWWAQALGVFYAAFLALMLLSRGQFVLSCLGALALLCSPFVQFWSLNGAPFIAWTCIAFVAAFHIVWSPKPSVILLNGLLLGLAGSGFLQLFYPPYQIVLGQLLVLLVGTIVFQRAQGEEVRRDWPLRVLSAVAALLIVAFVALMLERAAGQAIALLRESAYPGQRRSSGGGWPFWRIFVHDLVAAARVRRWVRLGNVCEAASFWLFFPLVAAGLVYHVMWRRRRVDGICLVLLAYCALLTTYCVWGVPEFVSRTLFLDSVPTARSSIALGVADLFLLVRFVTVYGREPFSAAAAAALALAWAGALAVMGFSARAALPELDTGWIAAAAAANGLLAFALLRPGSRVPALMALSVALAASTLWFNPVTRGGTSYLRNNPLSRALLAASHGFQGEAHWAMINALAEPNLLPALGLGSLSGTFPVPQLALWSRIDPEGKWRSVYNRYARFGLVEAKPKDEEFSSSFSDTVQVHLPLDAPTLRSLGATHVALRTDNESVALPSPPFAYLGTAAGFQLFRIADAVDPR